MEHPEWVLKDEQGNELYIPWGCSGGTCPQYAADFGNPEFRAHWIQEARELLELGYKGLWIDDVNLAWRVGDGNGDRVIPIDPRTGEAMTLYNWRRYFAEFVEEIRAALPDVEIAHNAIWYAGPLDDPFILRQIRAADFFNLERGANDGGLTGGSGRFGFETWLGFIDAVHAEGVSVLLMNYGKTLQQREYGLAAWLLINDGYDMVSSNQLAWTAPDSWWLGYELNLGTAKGPRYEFEGLIRRDFECGLVVLNQPDAPTVDLAVPEGLTDIEGTPVTTASLPANAAAVLRRPCEDSQPPGPQANLQVT